MSTPHPDLVDATNAARRLGIGRTSLYELLSTGELGSVRIGRRRLIPSTEIERFIAAHYEPGNNVSTVTVGHRQIDVTPSPANRAAS
jgi:excisionase family DNA binding protein